MSPFIKMAVCLGFFGNPKKVLLGDAFHENGPKYLKNKFKAIWHFILVVSKAIS